MNSTRADHYKAEQALHASASRLTALIENLRVGILVEDESRRIVHISQELCTLFGISTPPQELIGTSVSGAATRVKQLFADPEAFVEGTEKLLRERCPVTSEEWPLADGRTFERDYMPIFTNGHYNGQLWQYRDITERKRAEEALRASQQRFQILFEQSPESILLIEPEDPWRIVDCNPAACEMNGYSREELIGMPLDRLDPRWVAPAVRQQHIEMLRRGCRFEGETVHRRKDGLIFPIEYSTSLISIEGRELILGIDRDITERKQAHDQLAESERRFTTLLSNTPAMVYRCLNEPDWPMEFVSDYALELTGYSSRDFVSREINFNDLIVEDDRRMVWEEVQA
ncbi:MAG: PAS domain S-box protein, partial [Chloroflexota bacterium]|nr:PAS domain S-box protein [Chloroflexota bacterium]